MTTFARPIKQGGFQQYVDEVSAGFPELPAKELDDDLNVAFSAISSIQAVLLPDAPSDGTIYGRQNAVWAAVPTAVGIAEAPNDGALYGRKSLNWTVVPPSSGGIPDAPNDSVLYGRKNSAWVAVPADLWTVSGGALTPVDPTKPVAIAQSGGMSTLVVGGTTIKGRLQTGDLGLGTGIFANCTWSTNAVDDATKASWGLYLSPFGDNFIVQRAPAGSTTQASLMKLDNGGNLIINGANATKASGASWINPSDRRLKDAIADYATGLAAILQLQPRTFLYNGKGGSTAGMRGYGFIADEVQPVMPETVGVQSVKLDPADADETEIQTLDQSNMILALINATKELAARVTALEAA